jgi:uncharacterized membrane protein
LQYVVVLSAVAFCKERDRLGKDFCALLFTLICTTLLAVTAAGQDCAPTTPTASNDGPYCEGATIWLMASSPESGAYSWTGPNNFTSDLQNPTITNAGSANEGTYSVTVTADGCTSYAGTTTVTVNPKPSSTITGPSWVTTTSTGNTAAGPSGVATYWWSIDNGAITAGQTAQTVTFTAGATGTLTLTLKTTSASGCSAINVQEDRVDPQPTVRIPDVQRAEGNNGYTPFDFPVTLSNPSSQTVTVQYYTSNSTALAGSDYVSVPLTTLIFNPGDPLTKYVTVQVIGDTKKEANELFVVTVQNPRNAMLGAKYKGWGVIWNDD